MLNEIINQIKKKKNDILLIKKDNYDLLTKITSNSNYSIHELYYIHANMYKTCLQIFKFPSDSYRGFIDDFINDKGINITLDVEVYNENEYKKDLNKTDKAIDDTIDDSNKTSFFKDNFEVKNSLDNFDDYIRATNEKPKKITLRIYLKANTLNELQQKIDEVLSKMNALDIEAFVQTNDLESDIKALTKFDNPVKKMVASSTVADMISKTEISIVDDNIPLLGYTSSGLYAPDFFSINNTSYDLSLLGVKGCGKSALFKAIIETYKIAIRTVIQMLDFHNEYIGVCDMLEIERVSINEQSNVNLMQIFYTSKNDGVISDIDISSKISRIVSNFIDVTDIKKSSVILQLNNILDEYFRKKVLNKNINDLKNDDWFILGDVVDNILVKEKKGGFKTEEKEDIYNLMLGLNIMIKKYGYIYNRKTNIDFDMSKSLCFDMSFIQSVDDEKLINAYISLIVSYLAKGVKINLERNNEAMKELKILPHQLKRPLICHIVGLDETSKYGKKDSVLNEILDLNKYQRKAYSSLITVFHNLDEVSKENKNEDSLLKQLYNLSTNKIIGMSSYDTLTKLTKIIPELNDNDVKVISSFRKGKYGEREFFVLDDQKRKIVFKSIVNDFQKKYFGGGV